MGNTSSAVPFRSDLTRYCSYLLRLWREAPGALWRCQVHCVGTGQERRVTGLARLFEFLEAEVPEATGVTHCDDEIPSSPVSLEGDEPTTPHHP